MYSLFGIWKQFHSPLKKETISHKFRFFVYYLPLFISATAFFTETTLNLSFLTVIITSFSFFVGLLTNSVIFLLRYSDTNNPEDSLVDQTRNISVYLIVIGILIIGAALSGYLVSVEIDYSPILAKLYSAIIIFALTHFFFSILLLPARIFVIIEETTAEIQ